MVVNIIKIFFIKIIEFIIIDYLILSRIFRRYRFIIIKISLTY